MAATYDPDPRARLGFRIPFNAESGIRHRYEEIDDDHSDIDYRMGVSLPFLYRALMR